MGDRMTKPGPDECPIGFCQRSYSKQRGCDIVRFMDRTDVARQHLALGSAPETCGFASKTGLTDGVEALVSCTKWKQNKSQKTVQREPIAL